MTEQIFYFFFYASKRCSCHYKNSTQAVGHFFVQETIQHICIYSVHETMITSLSWGQRNKTEWVRERESDRERQRENAYIPVAVSSISFQIARIILSLSLSLFLFFILFVAAALVGVQKRLKGKPRTEHKVGCYAHWVSNIPLSTRAHAKIFVQQQKTKTWKNPVSCHLCTFIFSSSPTSAPSCYLMCTFFCLIPLTLSLNTSFYFMSVVLFDCTAFGRVSHCSAVVDIVLH